jgi:hypothetical protein
MWLVFLFFQLACLVGLAVVYYSEGRWGLASLVLLGVVSAAVIVWLALTVAVRVSRDSGGAGLESVGKPVPARPAPTHHLAAAKDLPPSERTHLLPQD